MKKFLIFLSLILGGFAYADTINLHWLNDDGTVYENSTCVIDSDLILPSTPPTRYGYTFTGWKIQSYIPIEYLEGTGTQYIDTGIKGNLNTYIIVDFKMITSSSVGSVFVGGYMDTDASKSITLYLSADNNNRTARFSSSSILTNNVVSSGQRYVLETNKDAYILNNNVLGYFNAIQSFETNGNLCFFKRCGTSNDSSNNAVIEIFFVRIYNNDVLVRDFIPVLDRNGTPCMFDKVEAKFYYNQGTGQFIAGPVLQ